ncbi:hypothetical protein KJ785_01825 [Patescibacteria group bacterium]|nr:hypothetical protein [Patescibacteria group bacterium]
MIMHLINFSGHPVAGFDVAPLVGVNIPMDNVEGLTDALASVIDGLPMVEDLKAGATAEVVLPGMSTACGVFLCLWHGRFGNFPKIRWAVRGPNGFEWPEAARADLQAIRLQARTAR